MKNEVIQSEELSSGRKSAAAKGALRLSCTCTKDVHDEGLGHCSGVIILFRNFACRVS
jgi:hypothetical protein